jgi:protein-S-isoprenylcysteine O-methyltransferase Ste14
MSLTPVIKTGICNAWLFMSVFIIQMFAIMLINKRMMERSHIPSEARKSKFERYIGVIGNFIWLLALCYSVFLPLLVSTVWFYIGLSVFVPGLILMAIATYNFIVTPADQLITAGAYRFSRHPMYLATFFICLGTGIAALSWLFILLSIIMAFCFYQEALIEERYCLNKYGSTYQEYMRGTPGMFGVPMMFRRHG